MGHRLAAPSSTNSATDVPAQVEHPKPPLLEPVRVELVRGVLYCHADDDAAAVGTASERAGSIVGTAWAREQRARHAAGVAAGIDFGHVRAARQVRARVCPNWGKWVAASLAR